MHFKKLPFLPEKQKKKQDISYELYPHQKEPYEILIKGWEGTGVLSMPCSTGKTIVLGFFLKQKQFKQVIMFSPTRVLAKQNYERIKYFLSAHVIQKVMSLFIG